MQKFSGNWVSFRVWSECLFFSLMGDDEHQRMIRLFFYLGFIKLFFFFFSFLHPLFMAFDCDTFAYLYVT